MSKKHELWHDRWMAPLQPPVERLSQGEMVARIEAARLEAGPATCPHCESTVAVTQTRTCYACHERKPITAFVTARRKALGHDYLCKACRRAERQVANAARKRDQFRAILGDRLVLTRRAS